VAYAPLYANALSDLQLASVLFICFNLNFEFLPETRLGGLTHL